MWGKVVKDVASSFCGGDCGIWLNYPCFDVYGKASVQMIGKKWISREAGIFPECQGLRRSLACHSFSVLCSVVCAITVWWTVFGVSVDLCCLRAFFFFYSHFPHQHQDWGKQWNREKQWNFCSLFFLPSKNVWVKLWKLVDSLTPLLQNRTNGAFPIHYWRSDKSPSLLCLCSAYLRLPVLFENQSTRTKNRLWEIHSLTYPCTRSWPPTLPLFLPPPQR